MPEDTSVTPEEQIRMLVTGMVEHRIVPNINNPSLFMPGIPIQDFTPYLLIKLLERLEHIEIRLDSIESNTYHD